MYGVPESMDLRPLHGAELTHVGLGEYQVQLNFHPAGYLSIEGWWELRAADGTVIDRSEPAPRGNPYHFHRLLGQKVTGSELSPPDWLALRFERGEVLRVYDDKPNYESFTVHSGACASGRRSVQPT